MAHARFIEHDGLRVLVLDYRNASADELRRRVDDATTVVEREAPESLYVLTLLHGYEFSPTSSEILLEHMKRNRPFVLASAVVGLGHLRKVLDVANRMAGRNARAFDDEPTALAWLLEEAVVLSKRS